MVQQTMDFKENVLDKQLDMTGSSDTELISDMDKEMKTNNKLATESNDSDERDDLSSCKDSRRFASSLGPIQRPNRNNSVNNLCTYFTTEYIQILNDLFSANLTQEMANCNKQPPPGFPRIQSKMTYDLVSAPNMPVKQPLKKAESSPWNSVLLNDFDSLAAPAYSLNKLSSNNNIERLWATV